MDFERKKQINKIEGILDEHNRDYDDLLNWPKEKDIDDDFIYLKILEIIV